MTKLEPLTILLTSSPVSNGKYQIVDCDILFAGELVYPDGVALFDLHDIKKLIRIEWADLTPVMGNKAINGRPLVFRKLNNYKGLKHIRLEK